MELLPGAIAGITSAALLHPIGTIKVLLQVQRSRRWTSATDVLWFLRTSNVGLRFSLFRGFGASLAAAAPGSAVYFLVYDKFVGPGTPSVWQSSMAGVAAQFSAALIFTPKDVVAERLQTQVLRLPAQDSGSWQMLRAIVRQEGWRGPWRGFWITLAVWGPYSMVYFPMFEGSKARLARNGDVVGTVVSAMAASAVAAAITAPIDTVKSRLQVHRGSTVRGIATALWRQEGARGFFQGVGARVAFVSLGAGVGFGTYAFVNQFLL